MDLYFNYFGMLLLLFIFLYSYYPYTAVFIGVHLTGKEYYNISLFN